MSRVVLLVVMAMVFGACEPVPESDDAAEAPSAEDIEATVTAQSDRVLARELDRLVAYADSIEEALRPVPLLTSREARAFDRYRNADQLAVARRLGVPQPVSATARDRLIEEGRLVPLDDSDYWAVRDLDHSTALVTPDVVALLTEIGERFQARIAELGLPPLRLEVTSVLRTADDQADLRRVNPNATGGTSTHQFGTTIDVAYSSFRAPANPVVPLDTTGEPWLEPHLRRVERLAAETGAARMSRELQAELAKVLREMQDEGKVMVTMEVRQPVFHMTVAQPY